MLLKPQTPEDPEGTPSAINKRLAIRCHDLMNENTVLRHEQKLLYSDLCAIAKALGVEPEGFGITGAGIAPSTILEAIKELRTLSPEWRL